VTAAATAAARGADTPAMHAALDVLACLPADNNDDDKFANVGGGGGQGRWPGDWRQDDHRSAICPCCDMSGTALRRRQKWNRLNFKRLGKVRVIIFENIFAIVVPVDLLSYVLGRWCSDIVEKNTTLHILPYVCPALICFKLGGFSSWSILGIFH
jgi:hypothetical protein